MRGEAVHQCGVQLKLSMVNLGQDIYQRVVTATGNVSSRSIDIDPGRDMNDGWWRLWPKANDVLVGH